MALTHLDRTDHQLIRNIRLKVRAFCTDESDVRRITEIPLIIASNTGIYPSCISQNPSSCFNLTCTRVDARIHLGIRHAPLSSLRSLARCTPHDRTENVRVVKPGHPVHQLRGLHSAHTRLRWARLGMRMGWGVLEVLLDGM